MLNPDLDSRFDLWADEGSINSEPTAGSCGLLRTAFQAVFFPAFTFAHRDLCEAAIFLRADCRPMNRRLSHPGT